MKHRHVNPAAWSDAIYKSKVPTEREVADCDTAVWVALEAMRRGNGGVTDFNIISEAVQAAQECCKFMATKEDAAAAMSRLNLGAQALEDMRERYIRLDRLGFSGRGYEHTRDAIELYSQFLTHLTRWQILRAFGKAAQRRKKYRATNGHDESYGGTA